MHVAGPVPERVLEELARDFDLLDEPGGAEGVLALIGTAVDGAYLDRAGSQLKIVANYGAGLDNVDLAGAADRGVVVTNTPDVLTKATAELAIGLMLALLRRVAEGDRLLRSGTPWSFSLDFMLGQSLDGMTVGIVGPGRIGRETARLAEAFGARPVFAGRDDPLDQLLATADIVSLHCPLRPSTRHLIDEAALSSMKPSAVLVNTARGAIVDERALVQALENRVIAGAALDVFESEPAVTTGLLALENVVLTPHLGSATGATRTAMGMSAVQSLREMLLERRPPQNAVAPAPSPA